MGRANFESIQIRVVGRLLILFGHAFNLIWSYRTKLNACIWGDDPLLHMIVNFTSNYGFLQLQNLHFPVMTLLTSLLLLWELLCR